MLAILQQRIAPTLPPSSASASPRTAASPTRSSLPRTASISSGEMFEPPRTIRSLTRPHRPPAALGRPIGTSHLASGPVIRLPASNPVSCRRISTIIRPAGPGSTACPAPSTTLQLPGAAGDMNGPTCRPCLADVTSSVAPQREWSGYPVALAKARSVSGGQMSPAVMQSRSEVRSRGVCCWLLAIAAYIIGVARIAVQRWRCTVSSTTASSKFATRTRRAPWHNV